MEGETEMEEKNQKKHTTKTGAKKMHGARKSKVDPAILAAMQHEANKLRIFKRMMILLGICVVIGIVSGIYTGIRNSREKRAHLTAEMAKLTGLARGFSKDDTEKIYQSAVNAAEAAKIAEDLLEFAIRSNYDEEVAILKEKLENYRKIMQESSPVDHQGFVSSTILMDMIPVKAGTFVMGAGEELGDNTIHENSRAEKPRREVTISKPFWVAKYEITNRQFRKLTPAHAVKEWNHYDFNHQDVAATRISWEEAVFFCKTLTDRERRLGRVPAGYEYRLPTEAEWEYVCRAGSDTVYPWGNEFGAEGAKYANSLDLKAGNKFKWEGVGEQWGCAPEDPFEAVGPTGKLQPNAWGICDMPGNVSEWCYDYYAPNAYSLMQIQRKNTDPCNLTPATVPYKQKKEFDSREVVREITCRVHRGGNWGCSPERLRSAARLFMPQNEKDTGVGFRPVLAPVIKTMMSNTVK